VKGVLGSRVVVMGAEGFLIAAKGAKDAKIETMDTHLCCVGT
jgi:hypothetical protein